MSQSAFSHFILSPKSQALLKRWLNLHIVIWILALSSFFIAWNRGLTLLYGLFSLLAAVLLISYFFPILQLRNLKIKRIIKEDFHVGQMGHFYYQISSTHKIRHIKLEETLSFSQNQKPKVFIQELTGIKTQGKVSFQCTQRGCFQLSALKVSSAYPFGIFTFFKTIKVCTKNILVFPKTVELFTLPIPIRANATSLGEIAIAEQNGRGEFLNVREYKPGDEISRLNWKAYARYQQWTVKEYERSDQSTLLVVLDCQPSFKLGVGNDSTFEYAITLTASMLQYATRHGIQSYFVTYDSQLWEHNIPPHTPDLYALFECLAKLNCNSQEAYLPLVEYAHHRFPNANLITTFRLDSQESQPKLAAQITHIDLTMNSNSFNYPIQIDIQTKSQKQGNRLTYELYAAQALEHIFQ